MSRKRNIVADSRREFPQECAILETLAIHGRPCNPLCGPVKRIGSKLLLIRPHPGVKIADIKRLKSDLAHAADVPPGSLIIHERAGPGAIGIEIMTAERPKVLMSSLNRSEMTGYPRIYLGLDGRGRTVSIDLAVTPHIVVGGQTGKGKSTMVQSALLTLLESFSPRQLGLVIIDPKKLDYVHFSHVPHLLTPVIKDMDRARDALLWVVDEMERRSDVLHAAQCLGIREYNRTISESDRLPVIVVVIDETSDLFQTHGEEVQGLLYRLVIKARAYGIHCLYATQRPSATSIPTDIRDNTPARVAFGVTENETSSMILGSKCGDAADLEGQGVAVVRADNIRKEGDRWPKVYTTFIDQDELRPRLEAIQGRQNFAINFDVVESRKQAEPEPRQLSDYERAYELCRQRRDIGISRPDLEREGFGSTVAQRLIKELEKNGAVGPARGNKKREILI